MSRRQLLEAARRVGVQVDMFYCGKRVPMNTEAVRTALLERLYGRNTVHAKTPQAMDDRILRGVACARGELSHSLGVAQMAVREGQDALQEYKRLASLRRRRPKDEAAALASSRQWLAKARAMQDQYEARRAAVQR
ncbi:hypothetical protein [Burkholderia pseudomallei]|uniref:hypothetical protein n=1 Tax=Burkholderia pseudomallei TaxID=28450 RepID=UPI00050EFE6A|nr:hypothetical protein [Burkholderia pseudomallei]KGC49140.1 hypothetical protein DO66_4951 [Burkholderia pseudomallei]KGD20143.1 hypothetical protein DR60_4497 [Burkholderia pseudomallei]